MAATAGVFRELVLEVSADMVRDCPGLSMDVGGSVAKIVYRAKEDWEELQKNKDAKNGKLRLLSCARTELSAAVAKVKADGYITRHPDGRPTEIYTCGIGCSQYGARINKELDVKLSNVLEMDCFIKAFIYLVDRYSFSTLIKPICQDVVDELTEEFKQYEELVKEFKKFTSLKFPEQEAAQTASQLAAPDHYASDKPVSGALGDTMYPCMLAMLGSAFAFMKAEQDGNFSISDGSNRGGRTLLGLGGLLLNAKSYDEIIDLAEKGNQFVLTTSQKAFKKETVGEPGEASEGGADVYDKMLNDGSTERPVFTFGNAVGKTLADYSREDVAAALVCMSVNDTVQNLYRSCDASGVKRAFVCGSYANRDYMRRRFTFEWESLNNQKVVMGQSNSEPVVLHFMKQGSHLGALGALINNVEHFIARDGSVAAQGNADNKSEGGADSKSEGNADSKSEGGADSKSEGGAESKSEGAADSKKGAEAST